MSIEDTSKTTDRLKRQYRDQAPKRIAELEFGLLTPQDVVKQSVVQVADRHLYDVEVWTGSRNVQSSGPLDRRMGTSSNSAHCETCGMTVKFCNGHFGYVRLALPVYHIGFLKKTIQILHCICKECSRVLLVEKLRRKFLDDFRKSTSGSLQRDVISKNVEAACRKCKICPYCGSINGTVKKVPGHALKIIHEKWRWVLASKSLKTPTAKLAFDASFDNAKKGNPEVEKHLRKGLDDLDPLRVLGLFRRISPSDCEILGMRQPGASPESLIWQYMPAPPVCIRPSVAQDAASTEDDITNKLGDIIHISKIIEAGLKNGQSIQTIMEQWDYLQIQCGMYINGTAPNLQQGLGKPIRGFCERLKGKQGRFRGNLSGKRVDFTSRTVISPDPNLSIEEVAVPERVAVNLTYKETVTRHNLAKLREMVLRGPAIHPGAKVIIKKSGKRIMLEAIWRTSRDFTKAATELDRGDVVERHLIDGDIVLFNRQPSLHKLSIMCHKVKVREWRTFRLNECVCTPYNADFDGDEMNLHVPQTEEARAEALELMGVKHNLATPKDGTIIIAATQDFVAASYLITNKDRFYNRKTFIQICCYMFDSDKAKAPTEDAHQENFLDMLARLDIEIPPPTILKPKALWTGKQIFNVLMRPNRKSKVLVNIDTACKNHEKPADPSSGKLDYTSSYQAPNDTWLCIRNSEIMSGVMDKTTIGSGKKSSLFYVILRDFGPDCAVKAMNCMAKLAARWLSNKGVSIGVSDVTPGHALEEKKRLMVENAYAACDDLIVQYKNGTLPRHPGCDDAQTLENRISDLLSSVRQQSGKACVSDLSKNNVPLIMAKSGAKGSENNVAQMVAAVGQQVIGGSRVADGFQDRTLPHFPKAARQPPSKGFVHNSFFSGLYPSEFLFHAMSGREGLVDTAVKTAETGYMSRRLMKSLEDLSTTYDETVRNSSSGIVQFQFGEDNLDPLDMEGNATPVDFERSFTHAQATAWANSERLLKPEEIEEFTETILGPQRDKLSRQSLLGKPLAYKAKSDFEVDQFESRREFLGEIQDFLSAKAAGLRDTLEHYASQIIRAQIKKGSRGRSKANTLSDAELSDLIRLVSEPNKMTEKVLSRFLELCLAKYYRARVQAGHAVGAVGAQSIGEPGTQMTLKTFHFAGVAGMSITQGVPRIKEIINAAKVISTPVIRCELYNSSDDRIASIVKAKVEKTYLRDIVTSIIEFWTGDNCYMRIRLNIPAMMDLQVDHKLYAVAKIITKTRGLSLKEGDVFQEVGDPSFIRIRLPKDMKPKASSKAKSRSSGEELYLQIQDLKRTLPNIVISGLPHATRAVIAKKRQKGVKRNELLVEGYGLRDCMSTEGINGLKTTTNSVMEVKSVLGIEAARQSIINELDIVMGTELGIDPRHMQLLADVMTYKGDVLGITRFGMVKMRDSVLQLASFEKTPDHLFDAASKGKGDKIEGVSECIIMGQAMSIGTGAMKIARRLGMKQEDFQRGSALFEDAWNKYRPRRR